MIFISSQTWVRHWRAPVWSTAGPILQPWWQRWLEVILLHPNVLLSRLRWRSRFCLSVWIYCLVTWRTREAGQRSCHRRCMLLVYCFPSHQTPGFYTFYSLFYFSVESQTVTCLPATLTFFLSSWKISFKISTIQRWCSVLECHRSPDATEVLRVACAEALCVAGVSLMSSSLREHNTQPAIMIRYWEMGCQSNYILYFDAVKQVKTLNPSHAGWSTQACICCRTKASWWGWQQPVLPPCCSMPEEEARGASTSCRSTRLCRSY